ncbi:methyltransferase, FxLD system [Streptomyces sp. NBC_00237]|uniref:methyltransferase, FxLD system n=1 Tax=Streptomyces sp. NBC_00237 TaxID=2975687 RepID=UPI002257A6CC|nr:methyltransferase, FxLD system [Streptomyces sp. NBC_00237]MCX5206025.1 methyltransferase, FxLD system [Streptomyces sp. NBC_00237]
MSTTEYLALRNTLVDQLLKKRPLPARVEEAMRTVRRDAFLPGVTPEEAYANKAVIIKDNPDGGTLALSCASGPGIVAMMLAYLDVQEGDNILEIGAGTGYNAALLSTLAGPTGSVTTIDVDSDVALYARTALDKAGYPQVHVMERDGLQGAPENAPYQAMEATVGVWDVPPTWWEQLADGGRLVMPLRWRGQTQAVALTRTGNTLTSTAMELCGFVPLVGQAGEDMVSLADDTVRLHHDQDQDVDAQALHAVLTAPQEEQWSYTWLGKNDSYDKLWLHITATDNRVCRIEVTKDALDAGVRRPATPVRSPALVEGDSLAYLILTRDKKRPDEVRLGAAGYGTNGSVLAQAFSSHIDAWSKNRTAVPKLTVHPAATPAPDLPEGHVIIKAANRIVLAY